MGLDGFEPSTPRLSSVCSDQLSYRPSGQPIDVDTSSTARARSCELSRSHLSRKEVIQPHLPIRLPCYDFTPVMKPTVVSAPPCG